MIVHQSTEAEARHMREFLMAKYGKPRLDGADYALNTKRGRAKFKKEIEECVAYGKAQAAYDLQIVERFLAKVSV